MANIALFLSHGPEKEVSLSSTFPLCAGFSLDSFAVQLTHLSHPQSKWREYYMLELELASRDAKNRDSYFL